MWQDLRAAFPVISSLIRYRLRSNFFIPIFIESFKVLLVLTQQYTGCFLIHKEYFMALLVGKSNMAISNIKTLVLSTEPQKIDILI